MPNFDLPPTETELFGMSNTELVDRLISAASENNEMDCRKTLAAVRREVLRRFRAWRDGKDM